MIILGNFFNKHLFKYSLKFLTNNLFDFLDLKSIQSEVSEKVLLNHPFWYLFEVNFKNIIHFKLIDFEKNPFIIYQTFILLGVFKWHL